MEGRGGEGRGGERGEGEGGRGRGGEEAGRMWREWSMHEAGNGGKEEGRKCVRRRKEGELEMEGVEGRGNGGALNGLDNNISSIHSTKNMTHCDASKGNKPCMYV